MKKLLVLIVLSCLSISAFAFDKSFESEEISTNQEMNQSVDFDSNIEPIRHNSTDLFFVEAYTYSVPTLKFHTMKKFKLMKSYSYVVDMRKLIKSKHFRQTC